MADSSTSVPQHVPTGVKKQQKPQQQKGQQQGAEFSQQKGRIDLKVVVGAGQEKGGQGRPSIGQGQGASTGSTAPNNRQNEHPKNEIKQQTNPAGGAKGQQVAKVIAKVPIRLSLFDHLPRKQPASNPFSIEGDNSLHPATIKLGKIVE